MMYQNYKKTSMETTSPGRLLVMLFEGAIKNLDMAVKAITDQDMNTAHKGIIKGQEILQELMGSLNMDYEISAHLLDLYEYLQTRLVMANIHKDPGIIDEVREFLVDMHQTWLEASRMAGKTAAYRDPGCNRYVNVTG